MFSSVCVCIVQVQSHRMFICVSWCFLRRLNKCRGPAPVYRPSNRFHYTTAFFACVGVCVFPSKGKNGTKIVNTTVFGWYFRSLWLIGRWKQRWCYQNLACWSIVEEERKRQSKQLWGNCTKWMKSWIIHRPDDGASPIRHFNGLWQWCLLMSDPAEKQKRVKRQQRQWDTSKRRGRQRLLDVLSVPTGRSAQ